MTQRESVHGKGLGPHFSVWLSGLGAERERERGKKGSSPLSGQRALKWKDDQREKKQGPR